MKIMKKESYHRLVLHIGRLLETGREYAASAVNSAITQTYWNIGRQVVEFEQKGKNKAEYGRALISTLAVDLKPKYGRCVSERNLWYMRKFYLAFPKLNAVRSELSWTHYRSLIGK